MDVYSEHGLECTEAPIASLKGVKASRRKLTAGEQQWMRSGAFASLIARRFAKRPLAEPPPSHARKPRHSSASTTMSSVRRVSVSSRRVLNTFGDDVELGAAVKSLAAKVRSR